MTNTTAALVPFTTDAVACECGDTAHCYFCASAFEAECEAAEEYAEIKRWEKHHCLDCSLPWAQAWETHPRCCGTCPDLPHLPWCDPAEPIHPLV